MIDSMSGHISSRTVAIVPSMADRIQAFRNSGQRGPRAVAQFLPARNHRDYQAILRELIHADVQLRQLAGETTHFSEYHQQFPELRENDLVEQNGYWTMEEVIEPIAASVVAHRFGLLPKVGDEFLGFHLIELLGKGAFGSVFLAEQTLLAGRKVALKVTTRIDREPDRLAKLQHTNIVPIYSVHVQPPLQALCMPYLGKYTLADIIERRRKCPDIFSASNQMFTHVRVSGCARTENSTSPVPAGAQKDSGSGLHPQLSRLARMKYFDAVLWLVARIADGLQHAHERGLIHRDLKPANVLLSDDGQPMLLDFNLAVETAAMSTERVGGTLAYIAPEQLAALASGNAEKVTARSDLFGLGVIFYELLTGKEPFPIPSNSSEVFLAAQGERALVRKISPEAIRAMIGQRQAGALSVRKHTRKISPAIASIVARLLEADPRNRYASAAELATDIDRHLHHLPLQYARESSGVERGTKWLRRNPTLLPLLGLIVTVLALVGSTIGIVRNSIAHQRENALMQSQAFFDQLPRLCVDLNSVNDPVARDNGIIRCRELLSAYGVFHNPNWQKEPRLTSLDPGKQREVIEDIAEALVLLARAQWQKAKLEKPALMMEIAREVRDLQVRTTACLDRDRLPASFWRQWAEIAEWTGDDPANPSPVRNQSPSAGPSSARNFYLDGTDALLRGEVRKGRELLEEAIALKPDHYPAHYAYGYGSQLMRDFPRALTHYRIAGVLRTDDYRPHFQRGVILCLQGRYPSAEREFDKAIAIEPRQGDSYRHRAVVRIERKQFDLALGDLDQALELGVSPAVVSLLKSQCYAGLGQLGQAERLRADSAKMQPVDEGDYLTRAATRMATNDAPGALSDLKEAVKLNPLSLPGLQNQAHVLGEMLGKHDEGLKIMDRVVRLYPDFSEARAGRAVLLARMGQRDEARAEIQKALVLPGDATIFYQAACVYSLTSTERAGDLDEALEFLRRALRSGFRDFAVIDADRDIAALRRHREFKATIDAARELYRPGKK
jgi:serine/threonine protein kinase/Tfp pilus assembly protein PilF